MKRIGSKALCILLTLVMAFGLLPGSVLAEQKTTVLVTTEQELNDALDGCATMIVLSRDISLTEPLEVSRDVELYMEDYLLSYSGAGAAVQVLGGTLTMSDGHLSARSEAGDVCGVSAADAPELPAILRLYNAGILTGVDAKGTFLPDEPITREQIAAMATRIADPGLRKAFTPEA